MENQVMAIVPSKKKRFLLWSEGKARKFRDPHKLLEYLQENKAKIGTLLGIMGGPGQSLFIRANETGLPVQRIPMFRLQAATGIAVKAAEEERAQAIAKAWKDQPGLFYQLEPVDKTMALVRQLTRVRLGVQDFRKPAQLQFYSVLRELRLLLAGTEEIVDLIEEAMKEDLFRNPETRAKIENALVKLAANLPDKERERVMAITRYFANPRFILSAKEDEVELEKRIGELVRSFSVWDWLLPKNSALPAIKGLGPSLGGSLVSEIADIRRFSTRESLRAYARFHVTRDGGFPRRKEGEASAWNRYLNRAVWLWSTSQMSRYFDHPWRTLYDWKKARELQSHPEAVAREVTDRRGRKRTIWDFTLKHCDSRAKRWTGSQMLNYLWDLWKILEQKKDPEIWYPKSSWPAYFSRVEQELKTGLAAFLESEILKRRRSEPKEESEEE